MRCPYDGFEMFLDETEPHLGWQCTNPLHPVSPRCPKCRHAETEMASLNIRLSPTVLLLCRLCCHVWDEPRRAA